MRMPSPFGLCKIQIELSIIHGSKNLGLFDSSSIGFSYTLFFDFTEIEQIDLLNIQVSGLVRYPVIPFLCS